MTTAATVPAPPTDRVVTLQDIIDFAAAGRGTLEEVSKGLTSPIDLARFRLLIKRIDLVISSQRPTNSRRTKSQFMAAQNRAKGKLFEQLVGIVRESSQAFSIYGNIQTLTNEIDWLVYLAPLRILLPALSTWGSHFICECKMSSKALDGNWVSRLYTLTQTHGTQVAVLFTAKEIANKGSGARPLRAIQDLCILGNPAFIIRVNLDELITCVESGQSPLVILSNKYVELRSRRLRVGLLNA